MCNIYTNRTVDLVLEYRNLLCLEYRYVIIRVPSPGSARQMHRFSSTALQYRSVRQFFVVVIMLHHAALNRSNLAPRVW